MARAAYFLRTGRKAVCLALSLVALNACASKDLALVKEKEKEKEQSQIVLGMIWEPISFNPLRGIDAGSYCASSFVYEGLVKFDDSMQLVPGLAESFSVSPDGLTYKFVLRPGLKYHNGSPLTVEDVKQSLLAGAGQYSPFRGDYRDIETVKLVGDRQVVVNLSRPCQPLLSRLAELRILPAAVINQSDHGNSVLAREPIATGPYYLKSWLAGRYLVFERNSNYWGKAAASQRIIWRVIPDKMALAAALARGEVDLAPADGRLWQCFLAKVGGDRSTAKLQVDSFRGGRTVYLGFNLERSPWSELAVRQAFACAIDRGAILKTLYAGFGTIPDTDFPETSWAFFDGVRKVSYSPKQAKTYLEKAGFVHRGKSWVRNGETLAIKIMTIKDFDEMAQVVADYLARIDIVCEVEVLEYSALRRSFMQKGRFDAVIWSRSFGPDPESTMVWSSKGPLNFCRLQSQQVDDWLKQGRLAASQEERKIVYASLQGYLAENLPWVFMVRPDLIVVSNGKIEGTQKGRQKFAGLPWDNIATNAAFWRSR